MIKAHSSGNGSQMRHLIREGKSASKVLQAQIDQAVALADKEIGIQSPRIPRINTDRELLSPLPIDNRQSAIGNGRQSAIDNRQSAIGNGRQSAIDNRQSTILGGLPVAPTHAVPPTPPPEPISVADYTERIRAGWVPVMGLPGTPITAGFVRDLGEYNPKLEGLNGIWTYQEMRRGDGQVAGTLRACKLPILSAKWEVVPGDSAGLGTRDTGHGTRGSQSAIDNRQSTISSTGAGHNTADKAKEVSEFIRANLFSGLEWQDHRGSWHTQDWKDVVRFALRMQDFGAACVEEVMAIDGDRIRVRRLCDRQALTFYRWHTDPHAVDPTLPPYIYDDGETLYALEQWGYRSNRFESVMLPADKACIFTHDQEGANFWGVPLALALDTPIPTPDGWTTMGAIEVGKRVFDDQGAIRYVTHKSPIWSGRVCYRLTFSSGTSMVADAEHRWVTRTAQERDKHTAGQERTTKEIFESQRTKNGRSNHSIETTLPLEYATQWGLPVPPWVLGQWLGDGFSNEGVIASSDAELKEKQELLESYGYKCRVTHEQAEHGSRIHVFGLRTQLRQLGVLNNKHVPMAYLRGSVQQRRELLAGLWDSDGSSNHEGQFQFGNKNRNLIRSTMELLRSLGEIPRLVENRSKNCPGFFEVRFTSLRNPFLLKSKAEKYGGRKPKWTRARHYITKVEIVDSRDTACIAVDSPSHLFLAGEGCIPTHNTRAMYPHWFVKKHLERIDAIACERNSLGVPMIMLPPNPSKQDVQTAQNWVTQLAAHEKTGLSLPHGAEFKLVGIEGRIREILPSLQYHKQQIATSCLAMFMELGQTATGSRALGDSQTDFFLLATQNTADYIAHQIRNSTIRRLVTWNFGPDAPVPHLVPANVQARSIETMSAIIAELAQAGAWISDRSSVNQARRELGFSDFADEDVVSIRGETIATPGGQISGKGGEAIRIGSSDHRIIGSSKDRSPVEPTDR